VLITKKVKIKPNKKSQYYKKLSYIVKSAKKEIEIDVKHLSDNSHVKVKCKCLTCNEIKNVIWQNYIKCIKKHGYYICSAKCSVCR